MIKKLEKYSALESNLGFLYQYEVALLLLLDKKTEVSIETIDDVVFEDQGNIQEIIQLKHHIKSSGSIGNRSKDLWKTLNIWIEGFESMNKNVKRILMTTSTGSDTSIVSFLRNNDDRNEEKAQQMLQTIVSRQDETTNSKYYAKFKKLGKKKQLQLLKTIYVVDSAKTIQETRKSLFDKISLVSHPDKAVPYFKRVWGEWINMVSDILYTKSSSTIKFSEFWAHAQNIRDEFSQDNLPINFLERAPDPSEIVTYKNRNFVKQLEWIDANDSLINHAIIEYWRAYQQRSLWVKDELLYNADLIKYENKLFNAWDKEFAKMKTKLGSKYSEPDKKSKGFELYDWADKSTSLCIRDRCTEPYVIQGSFHMLSNEGKIGWIVDFEDRLKKIKKMVIDEN